MTSIGFSLCLSEALCLEIAEQLLTTETQRRHTDTESFLAPFLPHPPWPARQLRVPQSIQLVNPIPDRARVGVLSRAIITGSAKCVAELDRKSTRLNSS